MNWFKFLFAAALSIIFVVSTLTALFGAGRVVNAVLETYVLEVENCRYKAAPRPIETEEPIERNEEPEETCSIDYNQAKRNIANGTGMFLVAAPLAWFMYGRTRKMIGEVSDSDKS
ncbi:MAG: hypothetical protein R3346_00065 [Candidatus Spechtbacterales bacterium]|nr:hypothetical protein [Candidatus Spechtbacterales bacterium]